MTHVTEPDAYPTERTMLEFDAPYLEDALARKGIVETAEEAASLFRELKRYLFLSSLHRRALPMTSSLVDAAWHQFVLYSAEYMEFCERCCGRYLHHVPRAAGANASRAPVVSSHEDFAALYARHFGPLPDVWHNDRCLRSHTRLVRPDVREVFRVEREATRAVLVRERPQRQIVCRTSLRAAPALEFIAQHPTFFVRELSGVRSDAERRTLLAPLVSFGVLDIAP